MKKWKPVFRNFLQDHPPRSRPQGRRRVTLISKCEKIKNSKWVFNHRFSWSRDFQIYLHIWNRKSENWDITNCIFWSILQLGFKCHNWSNSKSQNGFFLVSFSWLIECRTSYRFEFRCVELILLTFESSPSVSVRVGEESLEDNLRIKSVWNDLKAKI